MIHAAGRVELGVPIRALLEVFGFLGRNVLLEELDEVVPIRPHWC